ncbi:Zn-dependent protease with chaperone function [Paenibacillus sp. V4I3]|uniref:M48 family metallopeptidase n=1 Tax=Paenibacillus sp. V4I3 TaxID=3042305 RepID=UPI0027805231|nr:M48 family metallopeptidase [Paenibacillus sp. V4I3]MDQ0878742.1 Zn-dependent protease with chaperone function [Paenibacillus sp. V4I3]
MELTLENKSRINCPQCQEIVLKVHGYATWCDKCNWNINPKENKGPKNLFEKIYIQAGKKSSEGLLNTMIRNGALYPKVTVRKILTIFSGTVVHLLSLSLCLSGVYLLIAEFPYILLMIIGVFLIFLAWLTRPKGYTLDTEPLSRERFPVSYQIVDEIASTFGAGKVHGIIINGDFNAAFAQVGLKRKKIIQFGLPLIAILEKQELVALISHELAHGINGDLNRGFFIGSAINTLSTWYQIIKPNRLFEPNGFSFVIAICMIPVNVFLLLVSKLIFVFLYLICHLNWLDAQRAEYLADSYATKISGKDAKLSLLNKMHLHFLFDFCILKTINNRNSNPLFEEFKNQAAHIPEKELERINRINLMSDSRLDVTHPPTANRISYINSLEYNNPKYQMTDELYNQFINELSSLKSSIEVKILDDYKSNVLGF